jgi:hypothetical protein
VLTGEKTQWEFATPELREQFVQEASTPEPFRAGDWVVCVVGGDSGQLGKMFRVAYADKKWLGFDKPTPQWFAHRFRRATAAEIDRHMLLNAVQAITGQSHTVSEVAPGQFDVEPATEWPPELVAQLEAKREAEVTRNPLQLKIDDKWLQEMADKENGKCVSAGGWVADVQKREAEADGWIEWRGGECPVPNGTIVDVRMRREDEYGDTFTNEPCDDWDWSHANGDSDIVAYRVVPPEPPKRKQYRPFASDFNESGSKYLRKIAVTESGYVDVYAVLLAFNVTCPARQHAIKKLLCSGIRGKGDVTQDLQEARDAVDRAIQLVDATNGEPCGIEVK